MIPPHQIRVDEGAAGERLDVFLSRRMPELSRSKIQKAILGGAVLVNGFPVDKKTRVTSGDDIRFDTIAMVDDEARYLIPQNIPLDILYEDEYFVAVNKPAGMVVHPGNANREGTLVHALLFRLQSLSKGSEPDRPGIVHRLDKDTSGVIVAAKTDEAHHKLAALFASRKIMKQYVAICCGKTPDPRGAIAAPLGRSRRDPIKRSVREDGKEAETEYRLVVHRCGISVVRFSPHTGRTHQIRVHASVSGFPVVGDQLYGGTSSAIHRLPVLNRPFAGSIFNCFSRQALHARSISFCHPFSNTELTIVAPFPEDFMRAFALFEKDEGEIRDYLRF